jgi:hypothetical protein
MPNKYSHSVVLAHYSSLGLIDLPNDQFIAYLKTYPSSRRPSTVSRSQAHSTRTHGSNTSSTAYGGRYRIAEDHSPGPRSVTSRREYGGSIRRNLIVESDEGSGDEHVVLHKKYEPIESALPWQKKKHDHELRTEKRKLPSISTYTGRSSSEVSERRQQQPPSQDKSEPKTSPPSIINLNDYELGPGSRAAEASHTQHVEPRATPSSAPKLNHISAQALSVNERSASSFTLETTVYNPDSQLEPNFDGFSDKHLSEVTITGLDAADSKSSPAIPRSQVSRFCAASPPLSPSTKAPAPLPKRVDSAAGFTGNASKQKQLPPNNSYDSISSINSDDLTLLTTALPPVVPPKSQKTLPPKAEKMVSASRDPRISEDAIDPSFFDTLRGGPRPTTSASSRKRVDALHSHPPPLVPRTSASYSRHSTDHANPNPDFWRGLEEMLSDSDASVVFPPDIAKHRSRDAVTPPAKTDRGKRKGTDDGELKRPTTAPGPKTSSRDAFATTEPLPELPQGRSRITVTKNASLDKPGNAGALTAVHLVDTSPPTNSKKGFLRKLRKKSYNGKKL